MNFRLLSLSALLLGFVTALSPSIGHAQASPSCVNDLGASTQQFLGEEFVFDVELTNSGTPGFAPIAELVLPPGVSFESLLYAGNPFSGATLVTITDNDGGDALTGTVESELTGMDLAPGGSPLLPVGSTYVYIKFPIGSHTVGQGAAILSITASIDPGTDIAVALGNGIQSQCSYSLGSDALNNPTTDPAITTPWATTEIMATVFKPRKTLTAAHGEERNTSFDDSGLPDYVETATGPDYPITYTVSADVANTATATNITITDVLPDAFQFTGVDAVTDDGNGFSITFTSEDGTFTETVTSVPYAPTGTFGPGGTVEITINEVLGTTIIDDASIQITGYIPDVDANGDIILGSNIDEGATIINTADVEITYGASTLDGTTPPVTIQPLLANMQKSQSVLTNSGPASFSPGDVVQYVIDVQLSDYATLDDMVIEERLPDGLEYVIGSSVLEVTQGGAYVAYPLTEGTTSAVDAMAGTAAPYDFSVCGGCTLATYEDTEWSLFYDVSAAMAAASAPTGIAGATPQNDFVRITFQAEIEEAFNNAQNNDSSIDALDLFTNTAVLTGQMADGGYMTEQDSITFSIERPVFGKSIAAFSNPNSGVDAAPFGVPQPLNIGPGDTVTYSLTIDVPTGDLENLVITDFLPIPFFDATTVTTFDGSSTLTPADGNASSIPPAGTITWGSATGGFSTAFPVPALTTNAAENSFTLTFGTIEDTPSDGGAIEILFTVQASDNPFADGLMLNNQASFSINNSTEPILTESDYVAIRSQFPELEIMKGITAVDSATAVLDPAVTDPGLGSPFTDSELATTPIDSNATEVDAGDTVTFVVAIPNVGHSNAYDITLEDALPTGFITPATAADLNMTVMTAAGADLSGSVTGGLFGITPAGATSNGTDTSFLIDAAIPGLDYDTATGQFQTADGQADEGANIVLIQYDLVVADAALITTTLTNTASITNFSGVDDGPNYMSDITLYTDDATVDFPDASMTKIAIEPTAGGQPNTTLPIVTIGEVSSFQIGLTLPEGTATPVIIRDRIPAGMGYMQGSVAIDPSCTTMGTVPSFTATPAGTAISSSSTDLIITFDAPVIMNGDNDTANNTICFTYDVMVLDIASNSDNGNGRNRRNIVSAEYGDKTTNEANVVTRIYEPELEITKTVTPDTGIDAGDTVTYTIEIEHTADSNLEAYDLLLSDVIPPSLTLIATFGTDGLDNNGDGNVDELAEATAAFYTAPDGLNWNFAELDLGDTITLSYSAIINAAVTPAEPIINNAQLSYTTIAGANDNERTTTTNDTAPFSIEGIDLVKALVSTDQPHTTDPAMAVGEVATYTITMQVPEATITNMTLTDSIGNGMRIETATMTQDDTGTAAPTIVINGTQTGATFTWPLIVNPGGGGVKVIELTITATATDDSVNINDGVTRTNTATLTYDGLTTPVVSSASIDVVEPVLNVLKEADVTLAEAGAPVVYTLTIDHETASTTDAFDVVVTDVLAATLAMNTDFGTDGLDNDGDGAADEADEVAGAFFDAGTNTITLSGATTGTTAFDQLSLGQTIVVQFEVAPTVAVTPNEVIANTASIVWDSLPVDADADEREYDDSSSVSFTVPDLSIEKILFSTNNDDTTAAQLTALEDVAFGEELTYHLTVTLPAGSTQTLTVGDTLPAGITPLSTGIVSDEGITHDCDTGLIGGQTVTFTCANTENAADADTETITFFVTAQVVETVGQLSGEVLTNAMSVDYATNPEGPYTDEVSVELVEPNVVLGKTVTPLSGGSDDTFTYTLTATNNGTAPAYQLSLSDVLPAGLVVVDMLTDGLDNDGDAVVDNAEETMTAVFYDAGTNTFTWNETNAPNAALEGLAIGGVVTVQFAVTLDLNTLVATPVTNTVTGAYASSPTGTPNVREYTPDADDASFDLLGMISNQLWYDLNDDGVYDPAEPQDVVLAGVDVELWGDVTLSGTYALVGTETTDATGQYLFDGLTVTIPVAGVDTVIPYRVIVPTLPTGYTSTHTGATGDNAAKDTAGYDIELGPNVIDVYDADFGVVAYGSFGGTVWQDDTPDAAFTSATDDTPLPAYDVRLWADLDHDGTFETDLGLQTTDANGEYQFDDLLIQNANAGVLTDISYQAVLETAVPAGYETVHGLNAAGTIIDNEAKDVAGYAGSIPLTGTKVNPTADFGITLLGQVGGTVWTDYDNDGVYETGNELPVTGATLALQYNLGDGAGFVSGLYADVVTDVNGEYEWIDLPLRRLEAGAVQAITYKVVMVDSTLPDYVSTHGLVSPTTTDGEAKDPAGYDFDITATTDPNDATDTTGDFGYTATASVGDTVFYDFNNNGVYDVATEFGIEGIEVSLLADYNDATGYVDPASAGAPRPMVAPSVMLTDVSGQYGFNALSLEWYDAAVVQDIEYQVGVTNNVPAGYTSTHGQLLANAGDNTAHDPAGANATLAIGTIADQTDTTLDFGYVPLATVGSQVFYDYNYNGVFDFGTDAGMPAMTVDLWADYNDGNGFVAVGTGPAAAPVPAALTAITNVNGNYLFENLPLAYTNNLAVITDIVYQARIDAANVPAGYSSTHSLHGNATATAGADSEAKDPAGYTFTLAPSADPTTQIDITGDFGFSDIATLGDFVWYDVDGNGVYDAAYEAGIENVRVNLWADYNDGNGFVAVSAAPSGYAVPTVNTLLTDANGAYSFENLPLERFDGVGAQPIVYQVKIDETTITDGRTSTHTATGANAGNNTAHDPAGYTSTLDLVNDSDANADFAFGQLGAVGGTLFYDLTNDGTYNVNDLPMDGITMTLEADYGDGNGYVDPSAVTGLPSVPTATMVTDADGMYGFAELPLEYWNGTMLQAITYRPVVGTTPTGWSSTHALSGTADEDAHDAATYTFTTAVSTTATDQLDTTGDFGYGVRGTVGDFIFEDKDSTGTFTTGDVPFEGITVELRADLNRDGVFDDIITNYTTTATGAYSFTDLPIYDDFAGVLSTIPYEVGVTAGVPITHISAQILVPGATANDEAKMQDGYGVTLSATATTDNTADFGYMFGGEVGNTVFYDWNGNGVYEPSPNEFGIDNITLELWSDTTGDGVIDTLWGTKTTGDDPETAAVEMGWYLFDGLPVLNVLGGDALYEVRVPAQALLAPYTHTSGAAFTGNTNVAEDNNSQPQAATQVALRPDTIIGIESDMSNLFVDFGYTAAQSCISGFSFYDRNADVLFDEDNAVGTEDDPIENVKLMLWGLDIYGNIWGPDPSAGADEAAVHAWLTDPSGAYAMFAYQFMDTRLTDSDGYFEWPEVKPGFYSIAQVQPDGFVSTGSTAGRNLPLGRNGEGSVEGANGLTRPAFITAENFVENIVLEAGECSTENNFGDMMGNVSGTVFRDTTNDGTQDAIESGMVNVGVTLMLDATGDGPTADDTVYRAEIMTDANGDYSFDEIPLNVMTYAVITTPPTGYTSTHLEVNGLAGDTTANDPDGYAFTITEAEPSDASGDFGFFATSVGEVGSQVYYDTNNNGTFDAGDTPLVVQLELLDAAGAPVLDVTGTPMVTTSNATTGEYYFIDIPFGTYAVRVNDIFGLLPSYDSQHTLVAGSIADNDAKPTDGTYVVTIDDGAPTDYTSDFGYFVRPELPELGTSTFGGSVWFETTPDGTYDVSESGLAGVTVEAVAADGTVYSAVTDAAGNYVFDQMPDGTYIITVTDTAGILSGMTSTGTDATADEEGAATQTAHEPTGTTVVVAENETNMSADFGYEADAGNPVGVLGGTVTYDTDASGNDTAGDTPLANIELTITNVATGAITIVTTDLNGNWSAVLPLGDYVLQVTDSQGYSHVAGPAVGTDGNSQPANGYAMSLTPGAPTNTTGDFGFEIPTTAPTLGSIGNYVWFDADGSGSVDAGETGLSGVTIELTDAFGATQSTTTDAAGQYTFAALPMGTYAITVTDTAGVLAAVISTHGNNVGTGNDIAHDPTAFVVMLTDAAPNDETIDFGYEIDPTGPLGGTDVGSVGGNVWYDTNANGGQSPDELGLGGITVELYDTAGNLVATAVTGPDGAYTFPLVPYGDYSVVVPPQGPTTTMISSHGPGTQAEDPTGTPVSVNGTTPNPNETDFGFLIDVNSGAVVGAIGDQIWEDMNGDGIFNASDAPLAGIMVELQNAAGVVIATATTDGAGVYDFPNLITDDGTGSAMYTVVVPAQAGLAGMNPAMGTNATANNHGKDMTGYSITLDPVVDPNIRTADFAFENTVGALGSIGATVWNDANQDGTIDPSEAGTAGVTVELYNDSGTLIATTVTDANGAYNFANLPLGDYTVKVDPLSSPIYGDSSSSGTDGQDPAGYPVSLTANAPTDADGHFGFYDVPQPGATGTISGHTWIDTSCHGPKAGVFNAADGDTDYSGVDLELFKDMTGDGLTADDPLLATTTTTANGFEFINVPIYADYIVVVADHFPPSSYVPVLGPNQAADEHGKPHGGYAVPMLSTTHLVDTTSDFTAVQNTRCNEPTGPIGPVDPGGPNPGPGGNPSLTDEGDTDTDGWDADSDTDLTTDTDGETDAETESAEEPPTRSELEVPLPYSPIFQPPIGQPIDRQIDDIARTTSFPRTGMNEQVLELYNATSQYSDMNIGDEGYVTMAILSTQGVLPTDAAGRVFPHTEIDAVFLAKTLLATAKDDVDVNLYNSFVMVPEFVTLDIEQGLNMGFERSIATVNGTVNFEELLASVAEAFGWAPRGYLASGPAAGFEANYASMTERRIVPPSLIGVPRTQKVTRAQATEFVFRATMVTDMGLIVYPEQISISVPSKGVESVETLPTYLSRPDLWVSTLQENRAGVYFNPSDEYDVEMVVFGHSSQFAINKEHGAPFLPLVGGVELGEEIVMTVNGEDKKYRVVDSRVVDESEMEALTKAENVDLVVFTCDSPDVTKRHMIYAVEVKESVFQYLMSNLFTSYFASSL